MPDVESEAAAVCHGVEVPHSAYLGATRIARINAGRYEGQEIAGALHVVRPGDRVLELGAGLGIVGGVVAKNRAPSRLVAFEANPNLIPLIRALYERNGLGGIAEVRNDVLISGPERPERIAFHLAGSYLGSSLSGGGGRRQTVEVPTVDYAAVRHELSPDVLILDIEGGELELLAHADLSGLRAVVIEFHPRVYEVSGMRRCKQILRKAGFEPVPELSSRTVWAAERGQA